MAKKEMIETADDQERDLSSVNRLGTGNILTLVIEFAIPAIAGMVVNGAYNLIDSVFLGHGAGEIGLSTLTIATPTMTIFLGIAMLIGAGGNALCALRLGEGKHEEAERILGNTTMLSILISLFIAICVHIPFCMDALLTISSATDDVRPYATIFIQIISVGCVFQIVGMGLNNFVRTCGAPNYALITMVIGGVVCTVLNALFVLVLGWGVVGSALATVAGQAVSCVAVVWYFIKTPHAPLVLKRAYLHLDRKIVRSIFIMGSAPCLVQLGGALCQFVLNVVLVKYGSLDPIGANNALAAVGVVQRIGTFVVLPMIGVSVAIQPLLGFNYGAKLWRRVSKTLNVGIVMAMAIGAILWVLLMVFAPEVATFFGIKDESLVTFTAFVMRVDLIFLPFIGFQIVGANYYQATGQPVKSVILTLSRQILFLIPLFFILPEVLPYVVPFLDSLDAVYFCMPSADFLAIFTTLAFLIVEKRRLRARAHADEQLAMHKEALC